MLSTTPFAEACLACHARIRIVIAVSWSIVILACKPKETEMRLWIYLKDDYLGVMANPHKPWHLIQKQPRCVFVLWFVHGFVVIFPLIHGAVLT